MNPLTNVKNIQKLNERELQLGIIGKKSWHDEYKNSAWIFIGGLSYDLTEGDIICVFSQYGEVVNLNLIRDHKTGKTRGYGFLCYEDQRSTVLTVDNLNGIKVLGRTLRVDHVKDYKIPKEHGNEDEATLKIRDEGCAPKLLSSEDEWSKEESKTERTAKKQVKTDKNDKKHKKKKKKRPPSSSDNSSDSDGESSKRSASVEIKQDRFDRGFEQPRSSLTASGDRQRKEDGPRLDDKNSWHDARSSSQRSDRDLRHRDSDNGNSREIGQRWGYNTGRPEANGSYRENDFNNMLHSDASGRNRSRESDSYRERGREWQKGSDYGRDRSRESSNYWSRERPREEGRNNDFRREMFRESDNYGGRDIQRNWERSNDSGRERSRDQSWDRHGGNEKYRNEEKERYGRREDNERDRSRYIKN